MPHKTNFIFGADSNSLLNINWGKIDCIKWLTFWLFLHVFLCLFYQTWGDYVYTCTKTQYMVTDQLWANIFNQQRLEDNFKTQLLVDRQFRPVKAPFYSKQWRPNRTVGQAALVFWSRPKIHSYFLIYGLSLVCCSLHKYLLVYPGCCQKSWVFCLLLTTLWLRGGTVVG